MATIKRIVCLANSRKLQGRCLAGRELVGNKPGSWIRPVSDREHEEVSEYERQYADGSDPRVLDIIDVPLREPRPNKIQPENWLLEPTAYWARVGQLPWQRLDALADRGGALWLNGHSTGSGINDRVPLDQVAGLGTSLKLILVKAAQLQVFAPGEAFGNRKRRVQAQIDFAGVRYSLWVTDPVAERTYLAQPDATYPLGESYLTISLGEPYNDYCYKFVAAVIERR